MGKMADNQFLIPTQRLLIDHARIGQTFWHARDTSTIKGSIWQRSNMINLTPDWAGMRRVLSPYSSLGALEIIWNFISALTLPSTDLWSIDPSGLARPNGFR